MKTLPAEYPLEDRTVGRILAHAAACMGEKPLIIDVAGESISYREMDDRAHRIAHGLTALGIETSPHALRASRWQA